METKQEYNTLSTAINDLIKRGYTADFNLLKESRSKNDPVWIELLASRFKIVEHYRFDGMTNVDDESVLYVIETDSGLKGTLVDAYGVDADPDFSALIRKMKFKD